MRGHVKVDRNDALNSRGTRTQRAHQQHTFTARRRGRWTCAMRRGEVGMGWWCWRQGRLAHHDRRSTRGSCLFALLRAVVWSLAPVLTQLLHASLRHLTKTTQQPRAWPTVLRSYTYISRAWHEGNHLRRRLPVPAGAVCDAIYPFIHHAMASLSPNAAGIAVVISLISRHRCTRSKV